jgi:hypothetical protein
MASRADNLINNIDQTIRVFDSFYNFELVANASEYDIVYGYFYEINKDATIAGNFTVFLFRIAQVTGVPVLDLLSALEGKTKLEMNQVIAYYLNSFKTRSALYGISSVLRPNESVQRNIVQ